MSDFTAWRQRFEPQSFLSNLNVFIPLFVYGCLLLTAVTAFMADPDPYAMGPPVAGVDYVRPRSFVAIAGVLALLWAVRGLAPAGVRPERAGRYRVGHMILGVINGAVVSTAVVPLVLANLTGIEAIGHLMWLGIPVLVIAPWSWPVGLWMVWSSHGPRAMTPPRRMGSSKSAPSPAPSMPTRSSAPSAGDATWRVGHRGRDCMYYEELVEGRWERLEISGEMLMGPAHHVIYFASEAAWMQYPAWARHRRPEIVRRIKQAFPAPDYEHSGA